MKTPATPAPRDIATGPRAANPTITAVHRVVLTVSNHDQLVEDYVDVLGCTLEQQSDLDPAVAELLGHPGQSGISALLRLGRQRVELVHFTGQQAHPYPSDSTSSDLWFQHLALVVDDMIDAHRRVNASRRFQAISRRGPVRLPGPSGGVTAYKFRDRDGHPLELLAFPDGEQPREWIPRTAHGATDATDATAAKRGRSRRGGSPFLGIDHTAISARRSEENLHFYTSTLGLRVGLQTINHGPEQTELDDLDDAYVTVTRIAPDLPAPRLELLGYHNRAQRPIPPRTARVDLAVTHTVMTISGLDALLTTAATGADRFLASASDQPPLPRPVVTLADGRRSALITSPDGHRFLLEESAGGAEDTTSPIPAGPGDG